MYDAGIEQRINVLCKGAKPAWSRTYYDSSVSDGVNQVLMKDFQDRGAVAVYVFFFLLRGEAGIGSFTLLDNTGKLLFQQQATGFQNIVQGFYYLFESSLMSFRKVNTVGIGPEFSVGYQYIYIDERS